MPDPSTTVGYGTLSMLVIVMAVSVWLGTRAQKAVERGGFVKGYFLGNRGLGAWALALTATVQSGGSFMGFPSYVYTYGWIVALWIASYMVVPITGFAVLGKRFSQLSRRTGAITIPDLFDARYGELTAFLELSNLLDRANPCCIEYSVTSPPSGAPTLIAKQEHWLPLIPSLGVIWRF
jgi:sodium/pantothenate symporter